MRRSLVFVILLKWKVLVDTGCQRDASEMASGSGYQRRPLDSAEIFTCIESENEDDDGDDLYEGLESSEDDSPSSSDNESVHSDAAEPADRPRPMRGARLRGLVRDWNIGEFQPILFNFDDSNSGVNPAYDITEEMTEKDFFKLFFDKTVVQHVINETKRFYKSLLKNVLFKDQSRLHQWKEVDLDELYTFLAITLLMSLQKKQRINDYWSTDSLIHTPIFRTLMARDRYLLILRLLHFSNNEEQVAGNRLHKIQPILTMLKSTFQSVFTPNQKLCIDESLMLWKGRLVFKQYIPNKRHRFGIKFFILCDSQSGFVLDFIIYSGANMEGEPVEGVGISGSVVLKLIAPYLGKGHILYTDNWYSSPALFEKLHELKTGACGTVRGNRKGLPDLPKKMKKGDCVNKHTDILLATKWHDKRDVTMISTVHEPVMSDSGKVNRITGEPILKPLSILDYNINMGGIDKSDMQISFIDSTRKSLKWYKKLFFHLVDLCLLNAYILYKEEKHVKLELSDFKLEVVRQLIEDHHRARKSPKGGRPSTSDNPIRLTEKHFPSLVPPTEKKQNAARVCVVCSKTTQKPQKRKESRYQCANCNVGLCVVPCFEEYHTRKNF